MDRLTQFVVRHRRWVFAFWLVALVVGGASAGKLSERLTFDFSLPGQEGYETELKLAQAYGTSSYPMYIPVLTAPAGQTVAQHRDDVTAVSDALRTLPGVRVLDYGSTGDTAFLTADGRSTFLLVYAPQPQGFVDPLAAQFDTTLQTAAKAAGLQAAVTGYNQLSAGSDTSEGPSILAETLIGALGALVVLVFVFASFLALVPLMVAAVSILSTFLIVLGLTTFTGVSFVVQFLISLVGLGVAIDYSLLVVSRWREERAHGVEQHRRRRHGDEHRRPGRDGLGADGRDQPDRADRGAGTAAAQHGHRRHADPGGQHTGGAHAAACHAGGGRSPDRLAADPARGPRLTGLVGLGPGRHPPAVAGCRRRDRGPVVRDRPGVRHPVRAGQLGVPGQQRGRARHPGRA